MRFSHVALNCRDIDVTEAFYMEQLGFERARVFGDGKTRVIFLRLGEARLELFAAEGPLPEGEKDGPHSGAGMRHLAFQVDDVDAVLARLGDAAQITLGPIDFSAFIPNWKTAWLRDPDGTIVEISQGYVDNL